MKISEKQKGGYVAQRDNTRVSQPIIKEKVRLTQEQLQRIQQRKLQELSSPTEIEARGTQLKNYFDSDIITPDMLKYASQHYVPDTNMDNNMYQFFSGIKDWNLAADYLSKFSLKNGGKL